MSNWEKVALGKSVKVQGGYAFKSSEFLEENGIPIVRMSNIKNGRLDFSDAKYISFENHDKYKEYLLKTDDILIGMSGSIENVAIVRDQDIPSLLNQRVGRLNIIDDNKINKDFLKYIVTSTEFKNKVLTLAAGAAQLNISTKQLESIEVRYPPISEQKRIADILDSVKNVIEKTEAIINQTARVKKGLIEQLLSVGINKDINSKQSEIGEIPENWRIVSLDELTIDSAFGPRFPADKYDLEGNYALLRTTDIDEYWDINYNTMPFAQLPENKFKKHVLQEGDLLITRSGTCGVVSVFKGFVKPVIPGAFLIRFRLNDMVLPEFLRLYMMSQNGQKKIQLMASGGVQKNLSGTNLKKLTVPLPSIEEQKKIIDIVSSVDIKLKKEQVKSLFLNDLKEGLMQDLLSGRKRVNVDSGEVITS